MHLIANTYTSKYWLTENIKDCSNIIVNEKLKEEYNNINNYNQSNDKSNTGHTNIDKSIRINQNKEFYNRYRSNRYENKNNRTFNSKETNTHINISRKNNSNNYQKKMSKLPSSGTISEYERRNILLDSYSKPKLRNII